MPETYPDRARSTENAVELGRDWGTAQVGGHAEVREGGGRENDNGELVEKVVAVGCPVIGGRPVLSGRPKICGGPVVRLVLLVASVSVGRTSRANKSSP